jgi:carboxylesterase 2/para-nitrobenzyl esterase
MRLTRPHEKFQVLITKRVQRMDTVVEIHCGKLRGRLSDGVAVFKGVPYAAPPFGANRLLPPQPRERWDGVRNAHAFGPKPPQAAYPPGIAEALAELVGPGEDCLTLNIWAPELGAAGRPVMVWIPGGMFEFHATGATAFYDGSRFARDDVVCVTINYRVGAEGFLYLADGIANLGLLDQIAALEWVRENIATFGGDPGKVTIFGESAGGMSVATLLTMPRAKGLFRRAIVQSGNTPNVTSAATAARIGKRLAGGRDQDQVQKRQYCCGQAFFYVLAGSCGPFIPLRPPAQYGRSYCGEDCLTVFCKGLYGANHRSLQR